MKRDEQLILARQVEDALVPPVLDYEDWASLGTEKFQEQQRVWKEQQRKWALQVAAKFRAFNRRGR